MADKKTVNYHNPKLLPLDGINLDANVFYREKSAAEYQLGHLQGSGGEGLGKRFFNAALLISPLATKEAVVSSKIEGTISTVSDVYKYEVGEEPEFSGTQEVWNYRRAITEAVLDSPSRPMNKSYLKGIHKTLLSGVRHRGRLGDFRNQDVWIGENENVPIEEAIYVPPMHVKVDGYMDNLLDYIKNGKDDALTKAAIAHYQFEAIHPFEDGNGRVGRLLIPLILFENRKISLPILYMSGHFDDCKDEYRGALHGVDLSMKYEDWLKFFFNSVASQARDTLALISRINGLYEETEKKVGSTRSQYLIPFLSYIFEQPVFYASEVENRLGATHPTIVGLLKLFESKGIIKSLKQSPTDKRIKLYSFEALIQLLTP